MPFGSLSQSIGPPGPQGPEGPVGPAGPGTFSAEAVIVNAKDFGNDIQAAVDATPTRGTLYFPKGNYQVSSPISITKRINLVGSGFGSQIYQSADETLINIDASSVPGGFQYLTIKDLYLGSAATSPGKALLKLQRVHDCHIENVCMLGGYYGVHIYGGLRNTFVNLHTDTSGSCFGSCSVNEYFVYSEPFPGVTSSNANVYLGCHIRGGGIGKRAMYIMDNRGEGNFTMVGGTIEGFSTQGIYLQGLINTFNIVGVHLEAMNSKIEIVSCSCGNITGCYVTEGIQITRSNNIRIEGCYVRSIVSDKFSSKINVSNVKQGSGSISLPGGQTNIEQIPNASSGTSELGGLQNRCMRNILDGDLEAWSGNVPLGFTVDVTNPPIKTGTNEADPIKRFGDYAAKITVASGQTREGLRYTISGDQYKQIAYPSPTNYRNSSYKWTKSNNGTNEYYLELSEGGSPSIDVSPLSVLLNDSPIGNGTLGALGEGKWAYGNNDLLGYNTIYVRLPDSSDPNEKPIGYIKGCHKYHQITVSAWFYKPTVNGGTPRIYFRFVGAVDYFDSAYQVIANPDEWTRGIRTIALDPKATQVRIGFGMYGGSPDQTVYVDGIEITEGDAASPNFDDSRGLGSDLRVGGRFITSKITTFTTGVSMPSVAAGNIFKTADSGSTTITSFSNGIVGQEIKVIFGQGNVTVDFTGTNLKGNQGSDWTPFSGDHMTCIFDGTNWYCNISKNSL